MLDRAGVNYFICLLLGRCLFGLEEIELIIYYLPSRCFMGHYDTFLLQYLHLLTCSPCFCIVLMMRGECSVSMGM